ncbi:hypothetical protein Q0590_14190 [Rhodocytophaga aerolata]|uniref:Immunity protein 43 domain-containing protein n=1 Tax=Rhodocytophaga aerolata TaxID=455078 RepID=A0ABT8R7U4_9BACT|nr:hypothetical protein [Rhodocytophaga aerolata]MDO1447414.1 hypothetical protein [Rhodocytophaga aerolata]
MQQDTLHSSNFLPEGSSFFNSRQRFWVIEYSPVVRDFYINNLDSTTVENREVLLKGYKKDALFLGIYKDRETAENFANVFKDKLITGGRWYSYLPSYPHWPSAGQDISFSDWFQSYLASKTFQAKDIDFALLEQASGESLSYELISSLICHEFNKKPYGFIEEFCNKKKLPFEKMKSFINNPEFDLDKSLFINHILLALDYRVKMNIVILYEDKDAKNHTEDLSYYFIKQSDKAEQLPLL